MQIKEIEDEMKMTQKNKATNYHLGLLKGKLARLRAQLLEPGPGAGGGDILATACLPRKEADSKE